MQHTKNEANQPNVKILYSYISCVIAYFTHTFYKFNSNFIIPISMGEGARERYHHCSNKGHESNKLVALVCFQ